MRSVANIDDVEQRTQESHGKWKAQTNNVELRKFPRNAGICASVPCAISDYDDWLEEGGTIETKWTYVGEGNGEYAEVPGYDFVGKGRGAFIREEIITKSNNGWRLNLRTSCIALCSCICVLLLLFFVTTIILWPGLLQRVISMTANTTLPSYDCTLDPFLYSNFPEENIMERWSDAKKSWCCSNDNVECKVNSDDANHDKDIFAQKIHNIATVHKCNIVSGQGSSNVQLNWCCQYYAFGCRNVTGISHQHATTTFPTSSSHPSATTIGLMHGLKPNPHQPHRNTTMNTTASMLYDCDDGFRSWETGWSVGKQVWCCFNFKRGCPTNMTTSPLPH